MVRKDAPRDACRQDIKSGWNWRSPAGTAAAALVAAVALYLFAWHWEHTLGVLPYLALLACPLMHIFMHRGHRHGSSRAGGAPDHDPS